MKSTESTSNGFPGSRLLPSRWAQLGSRAIGWLFGDARPNGNGARRESRQGRKRARAISATDSESARKLRFWFSERNRHTL